MRRMAQMRRHTRGDRRSVESALSSTFVAPPYLLTRPTLQEGFEHCTNMCVAHEGIVSEFEPYTRTATPTQPRHKPPSVTGESDVESTP